MKAREPDTKQLLEAVRRGDESARGRLLDRHRSRLRQMVALRLDRRLAARVDPSDVVQEALAEADRTLSDSAHERPRLAASVHSSRVRSSPAYPVLVSPLLGRVRRTPRALQRAAA